jgi:hypothetical protein
MSHDLFLAVVELDLQGPHTRALVLYLIKTKSILEQSAVGSYGVPSFGIKAYSGLVPVWHEGLFRAPVLGQVGIKACSGLPSWAKARSLR